VGKVAHNIVILGVPESAKSFLAALSAQLRVATVCARCFVRVSRLLEQLAIARASADYTPRWHAFAKIDVLCSTLLLRA